MTSRGSVGVALTALVLGSRTIAAHADCTTEASTLRHHLVDEARRADTWNTAWALGFAFGAIGQLSLADAKINPTGDFTPAFKASMQVGALKSALGMAARLVLPLRLDVPVVAADPCDDVRALRRALRKAGTKEQRSVFLTLVGGTAVNLAGALYLWLGKDSGAIGIQSFLIGAPVGVISALTQPRGSARLYRKSKVEWTVGIGSIGAIF